MLIYFPFIRYFGTADAGNQRNQNLPEIGAANSCWFFPTRLCSEPPPETEATGARDALASLNATVK